MLPVLLGVPTLAYGIGYNQSMTVHNLLELWKLIQVGLLGFETTSVDIWCFKRVRVLLKDKISVRIGG